LIFSAASLPLSWLVIPTSSEAELFKLDREFKGLNSLQYLQRLSYLAADCQKIPDLATLSVIAVIEPCLKELYSSIKPLNSDFPLAKTKKSLECCSEATHVIRQSWHFNFDLVGNSLPTEKVLA
jgi:hypothetical protein